APARVHAARCARPPCGRARRSHQVGDARRAAPAQLRPGTPAEGAPSMSDPATLAADVLRERAPGRSPRLGIVLGSGLGGLAEILGEAVAVPYAKIPGFPTSTVPGHAGRV